MLDPTICPACGDRARQPTVRRETLVCAVCGHSWSFLRLPLLALTGPSGAGKSTVGPRLVERLRDRVVVLEQDVLWTGGLRDDVDGHPTFRATWLRMAAMIHQSGRPVVLCGTVVPPEFEPLPERVLFSGIHYLALVAEPDALARRLRARPRWRGWDEERIAEMLRFNDWLRGQAPELSPPVELLDTTHPPLEATVESVLAWVERVLSITSTASTASAGPPGTGGSTQPTSA